MDVVLGIVRVVIVENMSNVFDIFMKRRETLAIRQNETIQKPFIGSHALYSHGAYVSSSLPFAAKKMRDIS